MNHAVITKEELLNASEKVLVKEGISKLSMRKIADTCSISVGCIYNYFPSKSDLVFAIIHRFWNSVFEDVHCKSENMEDFTQFICSLYADMQKGYQKFSHDFLSQIACLDSQEIDNGKLMEADCWQHIKLGIIKTLRADKNISEQIWTDTFTQEKFADFVFSNLLIHIRENKADCSFLIEIMDKILYGKKEF